MRYREISRFIFPVRRISKAVMAVRSIIPALGRRQEKGKFEASLSYMMRPSLKQTNKQIF